MKLSDLGRGAHLQIRKHGGIWRATLRVNTDRHGAGVQIANVDSSPAAAVAASSKQALEALGCIPNVPPGVPEALGVAYQLGCAGVGCDMAGYADAFEDETLAELAGALARAQRGAAIDRTITLIGEDMGWRGGGGRGAFGARRAMVRRYARPARNRRPLRRSPGGPHQHPHHWPYPSSQVTPWPVPTYPVDPSYPAAANDDGPGQDPGATPVPDPTGGNPAPESQPSPAAPMRHKHHKRTADPNAVYFPDVREMVAQDLAQQGVAPPDPTAPAAAVQGYEMGWNPFHSIKNAVHHALHFVAHPPTWAQVIMPVLSPTVQKFAAEHVLGKQGDALYDSYRGILDAASNVTAPAHAAAAELIAKVPQIASIAQAAAAGGSQAVQQLAASVAQQGTADINALAAQATDAAQSAVAQGQGALDALTQDASSALEGWNPDPPELWSPSPYYTHPAPSSYGMPTRRPMTFADAYGRIYGPQPGFFRFPKAF